MKMDCATDLRPQTQSLASRYAGRTVLSAQDVEDAVAYLSTLR